MALLVGEPGRVQGSRGCSYSCFCPDCYDSVVDNPNYLFCRWMVEQGQASEGPSFWGNFCSSRFLGLQQHWERSSMLEAPSIGFRVDDSDGEIDGNSNGDALVLIAVDCCGHGCSWTDSGDEMGGLGRFSCCARGSCCHYYWW